MMDRPKLLTPWRGPMGGVPPLSEVNAAALREALDVALADAEQEYLKLSAQDASESFEDLIALEQLGAPLRRVEALYSQWSSCFADDELRALRREVEPRRARLEAMIYGDAALYQRVKRVAEELELSDDL